MSCFAGKHPFLPAMTFPSNLSAFGPGSFMSPVAQPEPKREALLSPLPHWSLSLGEARPKPRHPQSTWRTSFLGPRSVTLLAARWSKRRSLVETGVCHCIWPQPQPLGSHCVVTTVSGYWSTPGFQCGGRNKPLAFVVTWNNSSSRLSTHTLAIRVAAFAALVLASTDWKCGHGLSGWV